MEKETVKTGWEKTPAWVPPIGIVFVGIAVAVFFYWWLGPLIGTSFRIGVAAVTALAAMFIAAALADNLATKKGISVPGLRGVSVVILVGWACVAIPGLFAFVIADLYTNVIATFGGLGVFVVALILWSRRK